MGNRLSRGAQGSQGYKANIPAPPPQQRPQGRSAALEEIFRRNTEAANSPEHQARLKAIMDRVMGNSLGG